MKIPKIRVEKIAYKLAIMALIVSLAPLAVVTIVDANNLQSKLFNANKAEINDRVNALAHISSKMLTDPVLLVKELAKSPMTYRTALNASTQTMSFLWDSYEGANYDNDQNMKDNKTKIAWDPLNDLDPEFSLFMDEFADDQDFLEIFLTDVRGYTYSCNKEIPGDFLQLDEGWWTSARSSSSGTFIEFGFDDSTQSYLMEIIQEIVLPNGTFIGMIKAGYDVAAVSVYLEEVLIEEALLAGRTPDLEESYVFMVTDEAKIFTHTDETKIGDNFTSIASPTNSLNKHIYTNLSNQLLVSGYSKLNIEGTTYLAGYVDIHDWDISLFAVTNAATLENAILTSTIQSIIISLLIAIVCIIGSVYMATSFAKPINTMAVITEQAAAGDLTGKDEDIDTKRNDEIGVLGRTFRIMITNLRNFIASSSESAEHLASSAEEFASTSEEVNALSEEIAATIQQISRGASNQSELSTKAIAEIQKMSDVVDQSLKDIEGTLRVIEDIAGQTNILALNAAIEAARAGEYGRGFAVVADNVRRLAEETKTNSADIGKVTTDIVNNIGTSVYNLQETLQSFAAQSEEFSASSEEVAAATEEQTAAMNQMTSSAQELTKLGEEMTQLIAQYKTKEK